MIFWDTNLGTLKFSCTGITFTIIKRSSFYRIFDLLPYHHGRDERDKTFPSHKRTERTTRRRRLRICPSRQTATASLPTGCSEPLPGQTWCGLLEPRVNPSWWSEQCLFFEVKILNPFQIEKCSNSVTTSCLLIFALFQIHCRTKICWKVVGKIRATLKNIGKVR